MQQRGLVSRQECSSDARGSFICLTEAGWTAIAAAAPDHVEAVRRYFVEVLDAGELQMLAELSDRVVRRAADEGGSRLPCD
jgi:DNA-binding MarR family transcriptional regulator